jgi:hypothetical protein
VKTGFAQFAQAGLYPACAKTEVFVIGRIIQKQGNPSWQKRLPF